MKVEDKIINYAMGKQHSKPTRNVADKSGNEYLSDKAKVPEKDQSGQDTIVHLSPAIKEVQLIQKIISSEPDIRADKVLELKQRIESDKYRIDHEAVASKLVDAFIDEMS